MKLIHIINKLTKLFTLKRSCYSSYFPLKRSWGYAETLLRTIYTCIYLYIKTCSWQQQAVNYFCKDKKIKLFLLPTMVSLLLVGCQKTIYVCEQPIKSIKVVQRVSTSTQPAKFFLCGNSQYPCAKPAWYQHVQPYHPISSHKQRK